MSFLRIPVHVLYNRDLNKMAVNLRDSLIAEIKPTVREQSYKMIQHVKRTYFSGRPHLKMRSGNLKRSIVKALEKVEFCLGYLAVTGGISIGGSVPYSGVHVRESKTDNAKFTITAGKNRKYLTVPVEGGPADKKVRKRVTSFNKLVPIFPKNKTPFLAIKRRSGELEPVFWLKKKVQVPPRVFVDEIVDDYGPQFIGAINTVVNNFIKKNSK